MPRSIEEVVDAVGAIDPHAPEAEATEVLDGESVDEVHGGVLGIHFGHAGAGLRGWRREVRILFRGSLPLL